MYKLNCMFKNSFVEYGTFDYIIVGSGSSGSVIANRLTENNLTQVLVIEAGGYESNFTDIPMMYQYLQTSKYSWRYNTTTQTSACLGMIDQKCAYPRGKGVGGSSIINAIMYVRGNKEDYDELERLGCKGWSYEDVLPYFIKSENSNIPNGDIGYHGYGGYLNVEYRSPVSPQCTAFIEAYVELGGNLTDYNGKNELGVSRTQFSTIQGKRDSTGKAFIGSAFSRPNLFLSTESFVTKILINDNKQAYGVKFSKKDGIYIAYARNEVIISAGAIESPKLLMLSGIGPKEHLEAMNITCTQDLDVGSNFHDHITYYALNFNSNYTEPIRSMEEYVAEYLDSVGPYTIASNAQAIGFYKVNVSIAPNIELVMVPSNSSSSILKTAFQYTDETYDATWGGINPTTTFSIYVILMHPLSRGNIRLQSNDPYKYPLINPNFLSDVDGKDIERLHQGILRAIELVNNTNAFKELGAELRYSHLPQCRNTVYLSREFWYCQIRYLGTEIYHPVGTCPMGVNSSDGAVVDPELKVYGIKNLRVADDSIFPNALSGHTNAPAIMVGEKASDMIKQTTYVN